MRIKLAVEDKFGSKKPFLNMTVTSAKCRQRAKTKAFIDTGSPYGLILNNLEAARMHFPFRGEFKTTNLGGYTIRIYPAGKVVILFRDTENNLIKKEVSTHFAASTTPKEKKKNEVRTIPNIMGVEFLETNKYALIFCPHMNIGFLTDQLGE